MSKTMRIQFEVDETEAEQLDDLMRRTGLRRRKDLFNNALTILRWATRQVAEGKKIASIDEGNETYRELNMPALDHAAASASSPTVGY